MFNQEFLQHDMQALELEMERRCLALGLDFSDDYQTHVFAQELMQHVDQLKRAAAEGDMPARIKVELYGLALLMHKANLEKFGANYLLQIDELSKQQTAWAALSKAVWKELDKREIK